MRKYYLFIITKKYFDQYKNASYVLYRILENLYSLKTYDFSYGLSVYKELCLPFPVKLFNNYIYNKISYKKVSTKVIQVNSLFEETYVQINYATVILRTNVNFPQILKIFNIYSKQIFICDFDSKDYFWLNRQIKSGNFIDK